MREVLTVAVGFAAFGGVTAVVGVLMQSSVHVLTLLCKELRVALTSVSGEGERPAHRPRGAESLSAAVIIEICAFADINKAHPSSHEIEFETLEAAKSPNTPKSDLTSENRKTTSFTASQLKSLAPDPTSTCGALFAQDRRVSPSNASYEFAAFPGVWPAPPSPLT
jgi:hypothetical protein